MISRGGQRKILKWLFSLRKPLHIFFLGRAFLKGPLKCFPGEKPLKKFSLNFLLTITIIEVNYGQIFFRPPTNFIWFSYEEWRLDLISFSSLFSGLLEFVLSQKSSGIVPLAPQGICSLEEEATNQTRLFYFHGNQSCLPCPSSCSACAPEVTDIEYPCTSCPENLVFMSSHEYEPGAITHVEGDSLTREYHSFIHPSIHSFIYMNEV